MTYGFHSITELTTHMPIREDPIGPLAAIEQSLKVISKTGKKYFGKITRYLGLSLNMPSYLVLGGKKLTVKTASHDNSEGISRKLFRGSK